MKLLIKYTGKRSRLILEADPEKLVSELKKEIEMKFRLNFIGFRLIFTLIYNIRVILTDSFPLSFFGISQGSIIEVDPFGYKKFTCRKKCRNSTYLPILGIPTKYFNPECSFLDDLIEISIKGDYKLFRTLAEKYALSNPEEDILNKTHANSWSPLHYACFYGHYEIVNYLVFCQVNVNKVTLDEWTPLQLACFMGHVQCVIGLIRHKNLQLNKPTRFRGPALHLACEKDNVEIVKLLLDNNAYVQIKDIYGRIPFDLTCEQQILDMLAVSNGKNDLEKSKDNKPESMMNNVWLTGAFYIHDRYVFLYLNAEKGYLFRYNNYETFLEAGSPELAIRLTDIQQIREEMNWLFSNREEYYFVVETSKSSDKYYFKNRELTEEWISRLKKASDYFMVYNISENEKEIAAKAADEEQAAPVIENAPIHQENINLDHFIILDELGNGSFGTVYKVQKKNKPEEIFAMKCLNKKTLQKKKQLRYAISEIKIMKRLEHPFILTLHYAFQNPTDIYLILDYCPNGDLLDLIEKKRKLDEQTARFYLSEIILALEYLHSKDIIYRDLKPANILLDEEGHVKLADFGLAKENVNKNNLATTMAGTPAYLPPETIDQKGTSKPADIYGLGPLLYEMLSGLPPFYSKDMEKLFSSIKQDQLQFPPYFSNPAKEVILSVMNRNPDKRPKIHALKKFFFFRRVHWDALKAKQIKPPKIFKAKTIIENDKSEYCETNE